MIEDDELRTLFQAETGEHLQALEAGLLRLEADPADARTLDEVFRAAHSLKGAGRMLEVTPVETLAHEFEEVLGAARNGRIALTGGTADRLYGAVDTLRSLVAEALSGEASGVDLEQVLAHLRGQAPPAGNGSPPAPAVDDGADDNAPASPLPVPAAALPTGPPADARPQAPVPAPPVRNGDEAVALASFKIETMRVEPARLDSLVTLAGELTVTTRRVARGLTAVGTLSSLHQEWSRNRLTATTDLATARKREAGRLEQLGKVVEQLKRAAEADAPRLAQVADEVHASVQGMRLLPLSTLFQLFPRVVRDLARRVEKEVRLVVEGGETTADKRMIEEMKDPLMHIIRNAVDHGLERPDAREQAGKPRQGTLTLRAFQQAAFVILEVADDGRGLDPEAIRKTALARRILPEAELAALPPAQLHSLIFAPGFSTSATVTDLSGRGVGLDVVRANVDRLKGTIQVDSRPGEGCVFRFRFPITLATTNVLLVRVRDWTYGLPVTFIQGMRRIPAEAIFSLHGRPTIEVEGQPTPVVRLADLLELPASFTQRKPAAAERSAARPSPCVLLSVGAERLGLLVDGLLDAQEVMLKPPHGLLQRVRNVSGTTILGMGEICLVLNVFDLIRAARGGTVALPERVVEVARKKRLLYVEDSITTRTQVKRILEGAGYEVVTAVDGIDGMAQLGNEAFDAVVADIEMPNMDGLTLTARIRQDPALRDLPVVLVTSLASDDDRRRGMEAGANAYLTKGGFDQQALLETLQRLA